MDYRLNTTAPPANPARERRRPAARAALLGALAVWAMWAPPAAQAQAKAPTVDTVKMVNDKFIKGEAERQQEAERLYEVDRIRRESERLNKLRQSDGASPLALGPVNQLVKRLFQLPDRLPLTAGQRAQAEAALNTQRERAEALLPTWQQQVLSAAKPGSAKIDAEEVAVQLSARVINEVALWFGDAAPQASDAVWQEALRNEGLCQGLTADGPAARMAVWIAALPADQQAAAWAGEAARLARWGQASRIVLPPSERTLDDGLVPALAPATVAKTSLRMPAELRTEMRAAGWSLQAQAPAQRCELLRWWSQELVRQKQLSPQQALFAWRTAMAPRSTSQLLQGQPRSGAQALGPSGFPLAAQRMGLTGKVVVEQDIDASGKVLHSFIQRRELQSAILGPQPPLGLEHELDQASLDRAIAMPPPAPNPAAREGVATRRVGIEWVMN